MTTKCSKNVENNNKYSDYESDYVEFKIKNLKIKHKMENELLKLSNSDNFMEALTEWRLILITSIDNMSNKKIYTTKCLCHSTLKKNVYILQNINTNYRIFVGKTCYSRFKLTEINNKDKLKLMKQNIKISNQIINFKLIDNIKTSNILVQRECKKTELCDFVIEKTGSHILSFGKYEGQSIYKLAQTKEGCKLLHWIKSDKFIVYNKVNFNDYAFDEDD